MIVIIIVITIECLARLVGCTAACRTDYQRPEIPVKRDALSVALQCSSLLKKKHLWWRAGNRRPSLHRFLVQQQQQF